MGSALVDAALHLNISGGCTSLIWETFGVLKGYIRNLIGGIRSTANERNVIDYLRGPHYQPIGSFVLAANKPKPEPNIGKKGTVFLDWIGLRVARNDQLGHNEAAVEEHRRQPDDFATPSSTWRTS